MPRIEVAAFACCRCDHVWVPRDINAPPEKCPKCKSTYWDTPRSRARRSGA